MEVFATLDVVGFGKQSHVAGMRGDGSRRSGRVLPQGKDRSSIRFDRMRRVWRTQTDAPGFSPTGVDGNRTGRNAPTGRRDRPCDYKRTTRERSATMAWWRVERRIRDRLARSGAAARIVAGCVFPRSRRHADSLLAAWHPARCSPNRARRIKIAASSWERMEQVMAPSAMRSSCTGQTRSDLVMRAKSLPPRIHRAHAFTK